ncbi:thyrotropin-releasing hormone-degrading ectoenzyme [Tachysurus ichikawai]
MVENPTILICAIERITFPITLLPYPKEKQRFLTDVLHEVMLLDGLASSHPISQEVFEAADIDRVFDWIAYKKGAALIRMLANVMGQAVFQKGINVSEQ